MEEKSIGPAGGAIQVDGVTLDVPAGALSADAPIRVTSTRDVAPDGIVAATPVYRFEPDGLRFATPARVSFRFDTAQRDVTVMWSSSADAGTDATAEDSGSDGSANPCGIGQAFCGGCCIDTTSDPLNCGGCNKACPTPTPNGYLGQCGAPPAGL